jgi:shikimate kinase
MTTPKQTMGKLSALTLVRRVVLVGFMGSGKTRVGRALAERLEWGFRDFDEEISTELGLSIPEVFQQHGEDFFRALEGRLGGELLKEEKVVLASGGGWPVAPGRMDCLPLHTLSVWLRVSAEEAVRRAREEGHTRPLLAVPDPVKRARELLEEREAWYAKAHMTVDSEGVMPEDLARRIEDWVNELGRERVSLQTPET